MHKAKYSVIDLLINGTVFLVLPGSCLIAIAIFLFHVPVGPACAMTAWLLAGLYTMFRKKSERQRDERIEAVGIFAFGASLLAIEFWREGHSFFASIGMGVAATSVSGLFLFCCWYLVEGRHDRRR